MIEGILGVVVGAVCQIGVKAWLSRRDRRLYSQPELNGVLLPTPDDPRWIANHHGGDVYDLGGPLSEGASTIQIYAQYGTVKLYTRRKGNSPDWILIGEWPKYAKAVKRHVLSQKALAAIEKQ